MADNKITSRISEVGVTAFCFNKDRSKVCYATSSNELLIASVVGTEAASWKVEFRSTMHELTISCIDWGAATGQIVSCGHDRVAYVWTEKTKGQWEPEMVTLAPESNRGALCCAWSASGLRFCVGSSTPVPSICLKDNTGGNDWWISMALKGHSSGAIVAAAFCPAEDALLATGSADGGVRFVSTYTKMIDAADVKDRLGKSGAELCAYQASSVWINALAWNPTGTFLAAATHDSCIHLFSRAADSGSVSFTVSKRLRVLVPRCITFVGELQIVTAGADMFPLAYVIEGGKDLRYVGRWTATKATTAGSNAVKDAMSKFQNEASLGQATKVDQAATKHTSDITVIACVKLSTSPSGDAYSFATTGMDGRVEIWNGNTMERAT